MKTPSIVKFLIVPISLFASNIKALLASAVPAVIPSIVESSDEEITVVSTVREVSQTILPVTERVEPSKVKLDSALAFVPSPVNTLLSTLLEIVTPLLSPHSIAFPVDFNTCPGTPLEPPILIGP